MTSSERTADRIDQDTKGRLPKLAAGVAQRQTAFHPPVTFDTGRAMRAFSPQHRKTQYPLRSVIGGFDPMFQKKHPQRCHLPLQVSGQLPGIITARMVAVDQGAPPHIPGAPLSAGGKHFGHLAQALQFSECPRATGCQLRVVSLRQLVSTANEMAQTGLATIHSVLIDPVTIAHQDAGLILNQGEKGAFGAMGDEPGTTTPSRSSWSTATARYGGKPTWFRPGGAMHAGQFTDQCSQALAIAAEMFAWHGGLAQSSTAPTTGLV